MSREDVGRAIQVKGMAYAPTNEQGVVFLFGRLAPQIGFQVERISTGFPDCLARRRGQSMRIEFEYRASNYEGHPAHGADIVVCWENDWEYRPKKYRHLEIVGLKQYAGALPRIIAVGCDEKVRGHKLDKYNRITWSVPMYAQVDDLVVIYRKKPASVIRDIWRIVGPFCVNKKWGLLADLRCLFRLSRPVTWQQLTADPYTRNLGMVRQAFRGKRDITDEWPFLYNKIVSQNRGAKAALHEYAPD